MRTEDKRAFGLAGFIGLAGFMHFVRPGFFDPIVPDWMPGSARTTTYLSGAVELTAAALVAIPRTRRVGGWFAFATLLGVYPANIQAALDGGIEGQDGIAGSAAAMWLRLPLQIPMLLWARRVAREAS